MAVSAKKRMVVVLVVLGLVFGVVGAMHWFNGVVTAKVLQGFALQEPTVATISAQATSWQPQLASVGTVTPVQGAALAPEISGTVEAIHFDSGQDVAKGALLVSLRQNNLPDVLAELQAQAKLDQINLARDQKQFAAQAVSQAQIDTDRATLQAATAQVQAQQAIIDQTQIRAPFSGRVGIRNVNPGEFVSPGTALVTLEQLDPVYVDFYLPQQALGQVSVGQSVSVKVDAYPGQEFTGTISALDSAVDQATRSIKLRATLKNPGLKLVPGLFGQVSVASGAPVSQVTLPQTAITYNPYGDTVYVLTPHAFAWAGVSEGFVDRMIGKMIPNLPGKQAPGATYQASQVFVTLGDTRGDQVAVLSGVKPGDLVVTAGQMKLHNGALVMVNNSIEPANNPAPTPPNQ
jgi:membrane fusion protein (multidrug efflux system)